MARKTNSEGTVLSFGEAVGKFIVDHPWLTVGCVSTIVGGVTTCVRGYNNVNFSSMFPKEEALPAPKEEPEEEPAEEED